MNENPNQTRKTSFHRSLNMIIISQYLNIYSKHKPFSQTKTNPRVDFCAKSQKHTNHPEENAPPSRCQRANTSPPSSTIIIKFPNHIHPNRTDPLGLTWSWWSRLRHRRRVLAHHSREHPPTKTETSPESSDDQQGRLLHQPPEARSSVGDGLVSTVGRVCRSCCECGWWCCAPPL